MRRASSNNSSHKFKFGAKSAAKVCVGHHIRLADDNNICLFSYFSHLLTLFDICFNLFKFINQIN